jgi:hypothetical protein
MRFRLTLLFVLSILWWSPALSAMQVRDQEAFSPVTGAPFMFPALLQAGKSANLGSDDLGDDDDGCRHSTGISEYDLYLVTDPHSYYTVLASEYDLKTGQIKEELPNELKIWVRDVLAVDTNYSIDQAQVLAQVNQVARAQGRPAIDRSAFVMAQSDIPLEKRYRLALTCYSKRGARPDVMARIAQAGAWAIRARVNKLILNPQLDGAYAEVNGRIGKVDTPDGKFRVKPWLEAYGSLFNSRTLSSEGAFVAGNTYFGLLLRDGDLKTAQKVLTDLKERYVKEDLQKNTLLRGLVNERQRMLTEYRFFCQQAARFFAEAIAAEYYPRTRLPIFTFAVAEGLRRSGDLERAAQWYYALGKLPETQPSMREDMRTQGRAPGLSAPVAVQVAWKGDLALARLAEADVKTPTEIGGIDQALLRAMVFEGLGSPDYVARSWRPQKNGSQDDCQRILTLVGQSTMEWSFRRGGWPKDLNDLWENEVLLDRNRVNRFHCPVSGEPLLYAIPVGELEQLNPRAVIISTPRPIPTAKGPRYGAYLANNTLVWRERLMKPGEIIRD